MIQIRVECYAGYRADERPLRFTLRGQVFEVQEVADRWHSPGVTYFRVRADDGNSYVLRHNEGMDVWTLDGHRKIRIEYDCPACGMKAVDCERYETDKSDEELLKYFGRIECPNVKCKSIGKVQNAPASRIVLE